MRGNEGRRGLLRTLLATSLLVLGGVLGVRVAATALSILGLVTLPCKPALQRPHQGSVESLGVVM